MRTKIKVTPVSKLSPDEFKQCARLTFGKEGLMYWRLYHIRDSKEPGHAVRLYDTSGLFVAWALVFRGFDYMHCYIYTRASSRRKGYGKKLMSFCTERFGELLTYPHDLKSSYFFMDLKRIGFNISYPELDLVLADE